MLWRRLASLVFFAVGAFAEQEETELRQLNEDNFNSSIARGAWFVEFFSPRCWHCKAFAPTWTDLAKKKAYHEQLSGFHMAQVNCLAQGDLCEANNIKNYPSLMLYADGKVVDEFDDDRAYPILDKWIDTKSLAYARGEPMGANKNETEEQRPASLSRPNPKGKVIDVDEVGLKEIKAKGPVFVDFFAPWCSHCKKLRPVYERLATAYKGKLNIVAVNCDDHPILCKRNGVASYPTIKLFQGDEVKVFEKHRTLPLMTKFIDEEVKIVPMQKIMNEDFEEIIAEDDSFFVYLTSYSTPREEIEQVKHAVKSLGLKAPVYTTNDPLFYKNQSIAMPPPTSSLLAFGYHLPHHVAAVALPVKDGELQRFVDRTWYPNSFELSGDNYNLFFQSEDPPLVVLGAVRDGAEGDKERAEMNKMARAWKKGGRHSDQRVLFVAAAASNWETWLRKMVGIGANHIPAVVVIDTKTNKFYDRTIEGKRPRVKGADAFSVLEGIDHDFLKAKNVESALEWGSRRDTLMFFEVGRWSAGHPFIASVIVLASVVLLVLGLARCLGGRARGARGAYVNDKGGQRLD
ncbi:hypothetical protein CspeluHIS016_0111400 [Cutaneotrichosporon spelunceum]|uniref:Thioredoxin domain-containing protein n=1 Tax=Cutaneotrichosporon spelunceum TaxID=1672016 RepID=A0AAD3TPX7_9TREE|nr:hypothetical protein CspeluHIS016_0111400 [Cutaneotrichosporon spelunceum]